LEQTFTTRVLLALNALIATNKVKSDRRFALDTGIGITQLSLARTGKRELPIKHLQILSEMYHISKKYLQTGIEPMFTNENSPIGETNTHVVDNIDRTNSSKNQVSAPGKDYVKPAISDIITPDGIITNHHVNKRKSDALIPFYNADFMAGAAEMYYEDATIYPEYYMDVPEFYGCTAFRAYSDSMESKIRSGNILFGIKINDWRSHLEYGQIYGITCTDGRRYLKYIRKDKDDKHFLLKSENENYDDFTIPKSKINNIWLIE